MAGWGLRSFQLPNPIHQALSGALDPRTIQGTKIIKLSGLSREVGERSPIHSEAKCLGIPPVSKRSMPGQNILATTSYGCNTEGLLRIERPTKINGVGNYHPASPLQSERGAFVGPLQKQT